MNLNDQLMEHPVIAAIGTDKVPGSPCQVYFILEGEVSYLKEAIDKIKSEDKAVFVHMDLIKGIKADVAGLKFIQAYFQPTGIITTHAKLITEAKKIGLQTVLRLFLLDSKNLKSGLGLIKKCQPDAVEILPGALHKITAMIVKESRVPVITGGLILDKEDIVNSLKAGAVGVSTSSKELWAI